MDSNNHEDVQFVVLGFIVVLLLVFGSVLENFKAIDIIYMGFLLFFLGRYIYIKKIEH